MNIIRDLAWKNLSKNRKRTIATMTGIIIAVALICIIIILLASFKSSMIKSTQQSIGNYHFDVSGILIDEIETIKKKTRIDSIENIGISQTIGYANYKTQLDYKQLIKVEGYDDISLKNRGIQLIEGRLPADENEIVISNYLISNANGILNIGTHLELEIQKEELQIEKLTNGKEIRAIIGENNKEKKNYVITGIIKQSEEEIESSYSYVAITKLGKISKTSPCKITVLLQNPKKVDEFYDELQMINPNFIIQENSQLLLWQGVKYQATEIVATEFVAYLTIIIILIVSICLIKNSFQISFLEKIREFGILTSIGATTKQIKKIILYETIFYILIGIPIGVIIGVSVISFSITGINQILANTIMNNINFELNITIQPILISSILMLMAILFSCIKPLYSIIKITPIEVIRQNKEISVKYKKSRLQNFMQKNFIVEKQIAYKNLKRNKRKYKSITVSIGVIIIVIILLNNIVQYITNGISDFYPTTFNIEINSIEGSKTIEAMQHCDRIKRLHGINQYSIKVDLSGTIKKDTSILTKEIYDLHQDITVHIIAGEGEVFNQYLEKLGIKYQDVVTSGVLINEYNSTILTTLKEGENLPIIIYGKQYNIPIIRITKLNPNMAIETLDNSYIEKGRGAYLIIATDMLKQPNFQQTYHKLLSSVRMKINSNNPNQLEKDISNFIDLNFMSILNYTGQQEKNKSMMFLVNTFLYGLLVIVSVIGISNIYNTVTASMNLRKREFEILSSIGMTKKQANKMLYFECFLYTIKALIIGVILGLVLNYLLYLYLVYVKNSSTLEYYIPVWQIMVLGIGVFVTLAIIMKRTWKKLQRSQTN